MKPPVVAWELGKRLSNTAIISADSGTVTTWWAQEIPVKLGQMHSVSGTLGSMACTIAYAIASQIAYPEPQCVAFIGDGGFSIVNITEIVVNSHVIVLDRHLLLEIFIEKLCATL